MIYADAVLEDENGKSITCRVVWPTGHPEDYAVAAIFSTDKVDILKALQQPGIWIAIDRLAADVSAEVESKLEAADPGKGPTKLHLVPKSRSGSFEA